MVFIVLILSVISSGCIFREELEDEVGAKIVIETVGEFSFVPHDIKTVRPDIFKEGHFSIFDILAFLEDSKAIDMQYHFDDTRNTHVIDSINGRKNWWYMAYYDGGWPERNVFRMDHYPYKDKMYIRIFEDDKVMIDRVHKVFSEEIQRKEQNGGTVIIPTVIIRGPRNDLRFTNVTVKPHNLRNDTFQDGVITAIDVILSLGDDQKLSYDLQWFDSIGTAGVVRSYWVSRINEDRMRGRCGFVYEAGSWSYEGFRGNHIHIPSDFRVINSPEYEEWFWICI